MKLSVFTRKGLFIYDPRLGGRIVGRHFLGEPVSALYAEAMSSRWVVALRLGHFGVKLHGSDDAGAHWTELPAPAFPPKPQDLGEDPHPWNVDQVWSFAGGHPAAPRRLWAGTLPGGLFCSDDGGRNWSLVDRLWTMPDRRRWMGGGNEYPGLHSICVAPNDPDDIVVGVSCGGAWRTHDGGHTWRVGRGMSATYLPPETSGDPVTQDPHRIVRCAAAPQRLWTQHHCGIWRSDDGGDSWSEVLGAQPSRFGFAVAVDPRDPDRAWFVPAEADIRRVPVDGRMSVSFTADGGRSWRSFDRGLPDHDAYHLIYRHGLAISADGRWLAMGSTTGSLWASDDGGESWNTLSTTLPPINGVQFMGN